MRSQIKIIWIVWVIVLGVGTAGLAQDGISILQEHAIDVGDATFAYYVYQPEVENPPDLWPVMLLLHGYQSNAHSMMGYGVQATADKEGFLLVFPNNYTDSWGIEPDDPYGTDLFGFLNHLIDELIADWHADPARIYMVGISDGGMATQYTACHLSDRIAAFVSVAGPITEANIENCPAEPPVPILQIHGTADEVMWFYQPTFVGNGRSYAVKATASLAFWVSKNECDDEDPQVEALPNVADDGTKIGVITFSGCVGDIRIPLYIIFDGGHTWPGYPADDWGPYGIISHDIDGGQVAWDYVSQYTLKTSK